MNSTPLTTVFTRRSGLGRMLATGVLAVAACAAGTVWAQPVPGGPGMGGPGMHGQGMHRQGGGYGMMMGNPEQIGRRVDRMLQGLGVTEAQRAQIVQIATVAAADMRAQHEAGRALRQKGLEILTAPAVDAAAAEALRQQMLAQHDQASKRMLKAMLDIGAVLTPDQRAKAGERMKQRAEWMRLHHAQPASQAKS
jgi:Spy/CpxP family protein refolding chaperone